MLAQRVSGKALKNKEDHTLAITVKAFAAYRDGRPMARLAWDPNKEPRPVIAGCRLNPRAT